MRHLVSFRKSKSTYWVLLLIAAIVLASEGGAYYFQSIYRGDSSSGQSAGVSKTRSVNQTDTRSSNRTGNQTNTGSVTNSNLLSVSTLINYGNGTSIWYNETNVSLDSNFYNLTLAIANRRVESKYYLVFNEHYIISINGIRNNADGIHCSVCWMLWIYCKGDNAWSISFRGADDIILKNGDILAWYMENTQPAQPPIAGAKVVALCS